MLNRPIVIFSMFVFSRMWRRLMIAPSTFFFRANNVSISRIFFIALCINLIIYSSYCSWNRRIRLPNFFFKTYILRLIKSCSKSSSSFSLFLLHNFRKKFNLFLWLQRNICVLRRLYLNLIWFSNYAFNRLSSFL
jgi:hypothetical protein